MSLLDDAEDVDGLDDIDLTPDGNMGSAQNAPGGNLILHRELSFFSHEPYLSVTLANGNTFHVYPKSKGQLNRIGIAHRAYADAVRSAEKKIEKARWRREAKTVEAMGNVAMAEFGYYRALFEDLYLKDRNQDFTEDDFLALTPDAEAAIRTAFDEANDASAWVKRLVEPEKDKKKQTEDISLGI